MSISVSQLIAEVKVVGVEQGEAKLKGMGSTIEKTSGGFKGMLANAFSFASGMAIFNVASQAVGFLKDHFSDMFTLVTGHQAIMAQTAQAIKSTGDASGLTALSLNEMAVALSRTTLYSEDAVQRGENLLLTFTNIGKNVFPQATQAMLDMSQAMGQDVKESAIQLGKALNDPLKGMSALQRIGVTFSQTQKDLIKNYMAHGEIAKAQAVILQELGKEFGKSAQAAGGTFGGQLQILGHYFDEFKEKIGNAVLPILTKFLGFISGSVLPTLSRFGDWFSSHIVPALQNLASHIGPVIGAFSKWIGSGQALRDVMGAVKPILDFLVPLISRLKDAATNLWNVLGPLLARFGEWVQKSGILQFAISAIVGWIGLLIMGWTGVLNLAAGILTFFSTSGSNAKGLWQVLQGIGTFLAQTFKPVWVQLVDVFNSQIKPSWNNLVTAMKPALPFFQLLGYIIGGVLAVALGLLVGIIAGVIKAVAGLISGLAVALGGVIEIISGVLQIVGGIIGFFVDLFTGHFDKLGADLGAIMSGIGTMFRGVWNVIAGIFEAAFGLIWGLVSGFVQGVIGFFQMLWGALVGHSIIPDMINGIIGFFASLPGKVFGILVGFIAGAIGFFLNLRQQAINHIVIMVADLIARFTHLHEQGLQIAMNLVTGVMTWFQHLRDNLVNIVSGMVQRIVGFFQDLWNKLIGHSIIPDLDRGVSASFAHMASSASQSAATMAQNVKNAAQDMSTKTLSTIGQLTDGAMAMLRQLGDEGESMMAGLDASAANYFNDVASYVASADAKRVISGYHLSPNIVNKNFASGTDYAPGGMAWVGEQGPELMYVPRGVGIVPHNLSMAASRGSQGPIHITVEVYLDGARLTGKLMPHIVDKIRLATGKRM
jgi:phage-related protein